MLAPVFVRIRPGMSRARTRGAPRARAAAPPRAAGARIFEFARLSPDSQEACRRRAAWAVRPWQTSDKPGHWPYHLSKENTLDYIATAAPVASRHTLHAISHSDSGLTRHKSIVCVTLGKDSTPRGAQLATVYL